MKRDHAKLICDVGELTGLFTNATSLDTFLQQIVEMIANHMQTDVCSIYLYQDDTKELVLRATKGLNKTAIGTVRMQIGEGLTGMALKELRTIYAKDVSQNANYKFFPGIGEEAYRSFLAVPITRAQVRIGVIVIQSTKRGHFNDDDIYAFRAVTAQLANTVETTRMLINLEEKHDVVKEQAPVEDVRLIKGRSGCDGTAIAPLAFFNLHDTSIFDVPFQSAREYSKEEFMEAVKLTEQQLNDLQNEIEEQYFDVASLIFMAQLLMLKDKVFIDTIASAIDAGVNPPEAIHKVVVEYVQKFRKMENAYLSEKSHDVMDVGKRLLENLTGSCSVVGNIEGHVVVAREILPSDAIKLYSQNIKGLVVLSGGVTSHLSILCRSLQIPMVIADEKQVESLKPDTMVVLDATIGNIHVNPSQDLIDKTQERQELEKSVEEIKDTLSDETYTSDGKRIWLMANINLLADVKLAIDFKAEGVGLYRTEFPFMVRNSFPTEDDQFVIYRRLVESMPEKQITFRSLDIGGDKILSYYSLGEEENPFLGLRSIRFSLKNKDIFKEQIKAVFRAGHDGDIRLMFPMVSSLDEFLEIKKVVAECIREMRKEHAHFSRKAKIGVMIELPSAVEIIDDLAREADFMSVGTNDLIQYMLAVDRTNKKVADFYLPHHPAILRVLLRIVTAANHHRCEVTICGDMAHDPKYIPFLIGIGIQKLSLDARFLPRAKQYIPKVSAKKSQKFAQKLLNLKRVAEVAQLLEKVDQHVQ